MPLKVPDRSPRRGAPAAISRWRAIVLATLRRSLEEWFESARIRPRLVGEFQDSALLIAFAREGAGLVAAPTVVESAMRHHHQLRLVGRVPSIRERYHAITVDRKLRHPAAVAISEAARNELFA